jgi:transglycosylase-like protein with SLT domain
VKPFLRWFWPVILFITLALIPITPPDGTAVSLGTPPMSLSDQRDTIVAQEARRAGVSVDLALAVSHVENWSGDSTAISSRGAVGLMQVLPKYWQHEFEEECGCGSLVQRRLNACKGVRVLAFYLKQQKTTALALRAYHGSLNLHAAGDDYISAVLDQLVR